MKSGLVVCFVHGGDPIPAELVHEHHKWPRAAKGADTPDNLCYVCPTCHGAIDRGATLLVGGKAGRCKNMIEQYLPTDMDAQARLSQLINVEAQAWKLGDRKDERLVMIKLANDIYDQLKILAAGHHHANGRKVGVSRYMKGVLEAHVIEMSQKSLCGNPKQAQKIQSTPTEPNAPIKLKGKG